MVGSLINFNHVQLAITCTYGRAITPERCAEIMSETLEYCTQLSLSIKQYQAVMTCQRFIVEVQDLIYLIPHN